MRIRRHSQQGGFTLIEVIVSIVIFTVLSVIVGRLLFAIFNTFHATDTLNNLSNQALIGMERMAYDLHDTAELTATSGTSFTFVDPTGTSYTYTLNGTTLQRGSYTLMDSVQSIAFTYLDQNGSVTATPASVNYVQISLSLTSSNIPVTFTSLVSLYGVY